MAIVKIIAIRDRLDKRVNYAINGEKTTLDAGITYAVNSEKTKQLSGARALRPPLIQGKPSRFSLRLPLSVRSVKQLMPRCRRQSVASEKRAVW